MKTIQRIERYLALRALGYEQIRNCAATPTEAFIKARKFGDKLREEMGKRAYIDNGKVYVWIDDDMDGYVGVYLLSEEKKDG